MGYLKFTTFFILTYQVVTAYITGEAWGFIQNVNLIFHEAGHIILFWAGDFLSILGGSLLELLVPFIVTIHFFLRQDFFGASFSLWWLANAFLSVSIYAADAQERALPLITRDVSTHDWFNLLNQFHLLKYDDLIGNIFLSLGAMCILLSIYFVFKDQDIRRLLHRH